MRKPLSPAAVEAHFWARLDRSRGEQGCWLWTGGKTSKEYGRFRREGRGVLAHRYAWELLVGAIPDEACVLHRCDTPLCCNPQHLFLGSKAENCRDRTEKDRTAKGESHGRARVTNEQVREIRQRYRTEGLRQVDLAREYGVSQATITRIVRGANWGHVE